MTGAVDGTDSSGPRFLIVVDPGWVATDAEPEPPPERVVGGWIATGSTTTRFRANSGYVPAVAGSPTDPVDAALLRLAAGSPEGDELLDLLDDVELTIALDDGGAALLVSAPDGVVSAVVITAARHGAGVEATTWRTVTMTELAVALPDSGVDVLLNPAGRAPMRLDADAIRSAARNGRGIDP
ncbi:type VII secretion system-associated protein [Pseudonocardia sp. ICBG1122]|nr:type VII secretion system-associated protein [Pseudonocardia pini]